MASAVRQWTIREDGCLIINKNLKSVIYHSSLNSIVLSSKDQTITVLDATSGIVLKKSDLSGQKCEALQCVYLAEKDRCIFSDSHAVSLRRDLRGILLLDTALQTPVSRAEDVIKLEIPLAEALQLTKALSSARFEAGCDHLAEVTEELDRGIESARHDTQGSHKTAKWATVCLQLQHSALKSVCSALVSEMKRGSQQGSGGSQQGPGLPIVSAISDRLAHLLPSSIVEAGPGLIDKALMYSEAARRQTFSKWPHMEYKWALPEPMAQAGFYHQPNAPGDDRAMCFTCNVCLVCWEPTDEPWSEHERHSPNCPYIKGDYTQNVPLTVTYATHPAQLHGGVQDKIACISTTCNEDFIATSTRDGSIVVWDISHILQKRCTFNLDVTGAVVALKTGLQIESVRQAAKEKTTSSVDQDQVDSRKVQEKKQQQELTDNTGEPDCVQDILLHQHAEDDVKEERKRPSNDLIVSSLSIIDWSCRKDADQLSPVSCSPSKGTDTVDVVHPSLVCGVSLRRTKCANADSTNTASLPKLASSLERRSEVVQLMNKVNEGVRNEDLRIISDMNAEDGGEEFSLPDSTLAPHLLVVSFDGHFKTASSGGKGNRANSGSGGPSGGSGSGGGQGSKHKGPVPAGDAGKVVQMNSFMASEDWATLMENDPWLDPDVQIVGFTPSPAQASPLKDWPASESKPVPILQNGPSDLTSSFSGFGSEGSSPQSPNMHMPAEVISDQKKKEGEHREEDTLPPKPSGTVLQCIQLPAEFCSETLEVRSIQPTVDRHYAIVVVAPRSEYMTDGNVEKPVAGLVQKDHSQPGNVDMETVGDETSDPVDIVPEPRQLDPPDTAASSEPSSFVYGGLLVYKVQSCDGRTRLAETPCMMHKVQQAEHIISDIFVLPPEVAEQMDEEEMGSRQSSPESMSVAASGSTTTASTNGIGAIGQVSLILADGSMRILNLADARVIGNLSPEDGDGFISATYCTGIERLCMCTWSGKLKFYQVNQQQGVEGSQSRSGEGAISKTLASQDAGENKKGLVDDDAFEGSPGKVPAGVYLATGVLVPETLTALHSLTQFENLMPRFTATVPPCWSEIQQEQQQRRHPQHLQQQGEATQHTRTWKLTQNGSTWDDHLFEIVLPKPCCVGHVDLKFTLHPLCTTAPNIEVTLLKQNIGSMGRHIQTPADKEAKVGKSDAEDKENVNYVLDPAFLHKNNAEILCGPMKLGNCLSGNGGLASLASPKLLNSKPRSLLLHLKGFKNKDDSAGSSAKGTSASSSDEKTEKEGKKKSSSHLEYKTIKCLFENVSSTGAVPSAVERLAASAPKQKLTDIKGCDWLAELSVTVRKFKRTSVPRERQQRNAMLETVSFHERLLSGVTCPPTDLQGMNAEHFQNLALDILLWIGAIQANDPNKRSETQCLVVTSQPYLKDLIKSCFIDASRTTAQKCARLLALCIEYAKLSDDLDLAPSFSFQLLQAQVECLPLLVNCSSAGSMKWFFTLLNRVKCMDASLVARAATDMLNAVAAQYHRNMLPHHALLKTRYGLYGNPFEVDMFDVELPHNLRQPPAPPSSYASAAAKSTSTFGGPIAGNAVPPVAAGATTNGGGISSSGVGGQSREEPDLFEMLNTPLEKSGCSQVEFLRNHVLGLLEVEPLTFTCHATSDGTRVERMDAAVHPPSSGTAPTLNTVPLSMGTLGFDDPTPSTLLGVGGATPVGGGATGTGSSSGLVMADSLKKLAQMYAKQLHPGYKQIHQLISDHVNKAIETKQVHPPPVPPPLPPIHMSVNVITSTQGIQAPAPPVSTFMECPTHGKEAASSTNAPSSGPAQQQQQQQAAQKAIPFSQTHSLLQPPPDQVMVIERMHSGARRFVTLDFGKAIVLTDIIIPACGDLASLSIDVWVQGEEIDGQRLVVAADIGTRTLVMNNIMPAPICRYLKIITVGRYGAGTTRSRIPLGPFYGHSYILPWEWREYADTHNYSAASASGKGDACQTSPVKQLEVVSQSTLLQNLGVFLSLQEDLQCRYSLACTRLSSLLSAVADAQFVSSHVKYYLKRGQRKSDEDSGIVQSYNECLQLQLQLNLAQRAIARLQRALGMKSPSPDENTPFSLRLQQTSTDKLRVIVEGLLDTLLTLTVPSPAQPQPPHPLYLALPPPTSESLFRNLCLLGSRRIQVSAGLLLSRVCGSQPWWGVFLGNVLREFFHSEYCAVFPQDRVFVLLSALSQKALTGPSSVHILDSLLSMLTSVLQPLTANQGMPTQATGCLDLGLVSWILLFLCRNLDSALSPGASDESDKGSKREREANPSSRWSFIQGSWTGPGGSSGKSKSRKLYSRSMQKRILHHKQRLHDIEAAKSMIEKAKDKVSHVVFKDMGNNKEKALLKEQESLKKELAQLRSKHFKDLIYMRRNDLEVLRRLPKEDREGGGGKDVDEEPSEPVLVLPRERCLLVVRGLMSLLLSMDFSCHVDLFLVACKVLARICVATRPALTLAEVMSQEQLEQLILLAVHHDNSQGPSVWGGPWASHAITCLLQDILEGEKQFPSSMTSSEEDLLSSDMADVEEQLAQSASSVNTDEGTDDDIDSAPEGGAEGGADPSSGFKDTSLMMDLLMEDLIEDDYPDSFSIMDIPPPSLDSKMYPFSAFGKAPKKKSTGSSTQQNGELDFMLSSPLSQVKSIVGEKKTTSDRIKKMKTKLNDLISTSKSASNSHGLSVAQDARLEFGLQWLPELRMRVMLSVHVDNVFGAFTSPLPTPPQLPHMLSEPSGAPAPTDDELSQASLSTHNSLSSAAMLSQCFDHLFAQLSQGRVSLDSVLQLWLTINHNSTSGSHDDHAPRAFNAARIPTVPLGPTAVVHLMEAVMSAPMVSVRSWVFVLHTLCLLTNQRLDAAASGSLDDEGAVGGRDSSTTSGTSGMDSVGCGMMASTVLTDPNLVPLILKFLSGSSANSPSSSGLQFYQVGPSATRAFDDFLHRLLCKSVDLNGQNLKELLLKIVYQLTADKGSISACTGPLDAQCKFVETVSGVAFDTVDLSNAISVVASISTLVHQHILCQDPILCSASHDASISARSCFSGLFASLLRGGESRGAGGEASRDQLMCSLLRLVNKLVQVPLPGCAAPRVSSTCAMSEGSMGMDQVELQEGMSDAAKLNWAFSSSLVSVPMSPMSDDEKRQQNNSGGASAGASINSSVSELGSGPDSSPSFDVRATGERYVADIILGNPLVMQSLVQALSFCSSNKMALILGSAPTTTTLSSSTSGNANDNFNMADPLSVGDGIYQILCTLLLRATNPNAVTESLFKYLSGSYPQLDSGALCRLSEPLLKFLLRVLDSPAAIRHFVELGGVEVVCSSLVRSSRQFISVGPSMISTIMQNMTSVAAAAAEEKAKAADSDNVEGLFNFAPHGTIMSTSPTASPADALIQTSAPHRRARTAAWSYHFYPDEPWVELVITLPFAILLRQVQIRPHNGALTTCPSFVSLEISHDGQNVIPTSPPLVTCSLAVIKLQLLRPEVVNVVTLRLHRPRDSMTIGLQQVCLRGQRAFGEMTEASSTFLPCEDTMTRCSMGWLRLLHHCLLAHKEVQQDVALAATPTCNLLNTCTSLLVSPATSLYAAKIESVLLRLGLSSEEIGLALIDNVLRNPVLYGDRGGGHVYLGRVNGMASPYTVEILYQLGITQDSGTKSRVHALLRWLADSAQSHLHRASAERGHRMGVFAHDPASTLSTSPASEHVHCVAAVLWYSHERPVDYDLLSLLTPDLIRHLYEWSSSLPVNSLLKKAVNHVLCAACHIHPPYFQQLLHWAGFLGPDLSATATDDSKDNAQQQQDAEGPGPLTDDSKEASRQPLHQDQQPGTMTDDSKEATRLSHSQQALSSLPLDKGQLENIAVVCRSPASVAQLLESGLPTVLAQGLAEFCSRQITLIVERNLVSDAERLQQQQQQQAPQQAAPDNGPRRGEWPDAEPDSNGLTAELVASILSFFAELCCEPSIRDWLGTAEGNVFWPALLTMLCNTSTQRPALSTLPVPHRHKVMSAEERFLIESTAIRFFTQVIACHSVNQLFFAKVLCDVIREQGVSRAGLLLGTVPLSGFTRRMLLQVLLEDEKVTVALRASPEFYCRLNISSMAGNGSGGAGEKGFGCQVHHPRFGAGRGSCSVTVNINSPCSEVLTRFGDPTAAAMVASSLLECRDDRKRAEELAKESGDLGIEVMEYINAAGVLAKEKREKSPSPSKTGLPPRPPTRRGHRPSDTGLSGLKFPHFTLHLQHELMKSKALPGDLTFSQLMQILLQRGLAPGTTALPFTITLSTRTSVPPPTLQAALAAAQQGASGGIDEWGDNPEDIPDEILLASPSFPSALQVFASVGGLALLAEHLPLLYPDITRQGTAADVSTSDNNNIADLGQDWVTVESSDELYDPYMEPVSPAPASSHAARHVAGAMPTIPPHSLIAFGLFLRLPGYAEVLLKERKKAQCLLRLVLGVTDDGDGGHILTSPIASSLPTLPFTVLKSLFDASPLTTDDGVLLRRMGLDIGVLHLVLACLSVLSHHGPRVPVSGFQQETQMILTAMQTAATQSGMAQNEEKTQHYWAKGTGFGTGSTTSSWDAEQALLRQRSEEEHVACLLQVLGSYINPGGHIPKDFFGEDKEQDGGEGSSTTAAYTPPSEKWLLPEVVSELLSQSCLIPAMSSYLRNDSVLDMARHVPLYRALLQLLRGMAVCPPLVPLLLPMPAPQSQQQQQNAESADVSSVSVEKLLTKMKGCVDTYASRLKSNKGKTMISSKADEEESEGLALLIPDIQETASIVKLATQRLKDAEDHADGSSDSTTSAASAAKTTEERYLALLGPLQFDTYELVVEEGRGLKFNIPHHFESNVKASGAFNNPSRTRRLAQEAVTLSTSLPLSYNSSVFVRCDEERLDIMKVLITGPSDTPYANGAFEFDVYFPQDYPNSPPYINLETTGNHTVRFNPNLYNDGKVCLSILNTWHGRPEEKWNAQTSSFLQVLVSIQSLILVSEPYFNEPGYERSRCTPSGTASSREYDANIRQATVKWAMLEQLRNVSPCFKEVVHHHFWVKRHEVLKQCEEWIAEMEQFSNDKRTGRSISHSTMALKRHYNQLREELAKLKPPPELEAESEVETIDPKGKQYSTDAAQAAAATPSTSSMVPKPTNAPTTSNLSVNSIGLGPYVGPNGMFFTDPMDQDLPDV